MAWLFISLVPPFLYAATNHIDKYLISRQLEGRGIGALIIFSGLFSVLVLPIIWLIEPAAVTLNWLTALALAGSGSLTVFSILCYLYALEDDETSVVIPFYQTIPLFSYALGFLIFGEWLTRGQLLGSALVLIGASVLAFDLENGARRFRRRVVFLMLLASLLYAVNGAIFKFFALDFGFWTSLFWDFAGKVGVGLAFLFLVASYRREFLAAFQRSRGAVFALNSTSEVLTIIADSLAGYAFLLAPIALVSVALSGFQPVFVFVLGILFTLFLPRLGRETITRRAVVQRFSAIALILAGTAFLG